MLSNWRTVIRHADLEPPEKEQNVHVCNKHTIVIIYTYDYLQNFTVFEANFFQLMTMQLWSVLKPFGEIESYLWYLFLADAYTAQPWSLGLPY